MIHPYPARQRRHCCALCIVSTIAFVATCEAPWCPCPPRYSCIKTQFNFDAVASNMGSFQFSEPQLVGESNTASNTHFWMPGVGGLVAIGPPGNQSLLLNVDVNGDGTRPIDCEAVQCPPKNYIAAGAARGGAPWVGQPNMTSVPTNALIRMTNPNASSASFFRGFEGVRLDSSNASGCIAYADWMFHEGTTHQAKAQRGEKCAPLRGLPRMASGALQLMPSGGTLADGTRLAMGYGAVYNATLTPGATAAPGNGYSSFLFASADDGASWAVRHRFAATALMPSAVGCGGWSPPTMGVCGPCEPAFTVLNDGRTVLAMLRIQSAQNLWQAVSRDGGVTFSDAVETAAWSVFPQLRTLRNGAVVLASGRPAIGMWQFDAHTLEWGGFRNLAAAHNAALSPAAPKDYAFDAPEAAVANRSSPVTAPALTKAYMALEALTCESGSSVCSVVVAYDRLANGNGVPPGPNGLKDRVFTMRVEVTTALRTHI